MNRITTPGVYLDMAAADYFADPAPDPSLTQSIAKILIERSPAHARLEHPRLCPPTIEDEPAEKYVAAHAIGNMAHALMIGRGKGFAVADFDSWRTKEAKAFRDDCELHGRVPVLKKHAERARNLEQSARDQLDLAGHTEAFANNRGHGEVVLCWQEGGIWCRTMIDWMCDTTRLYDLKTSGMSCAPHVVVDRPSIENWDIQAAMHERGLDILDPDNAGRRQHHYVAIENEPPYGLTVVRISEADLTMGRKKLDYAFALWAECLNNDSWPCYPPDTITSTPRGWTETQWLQREVDHDERRKRKPSIPLDSLMGG